MDGSLGILFNYKGEWVFSARGSFTSEQSVRGLQMLSEYQYQKLHNGYTYLFEIIYNENRIVVKYSFEDVILLGMINNESGKEIDIHNGPFRVLNMISDIGLNVVKKYNNIPDYSVSRYSFNEFKGMIEDNAEGFVIRFSNGDRMKIKGVEYLKLHKIMTETSTTSVWKGLRNGDDIYKILEDVPDEFFNKIEEYVEELKSQYTKLETEYTWIFNKLRNVYFDVYKKKFTRAEFAKKAKNYKYPQLLFKMLDGADYTKSLWEILKPEFRKL
jgi:hypothetical protein